MAVRARLTPPRKERTEWTWHQVKSASLPASIFCSAARRMEADGFLSRGFRTRTAIESKSSGWISLKNIARVWQPSRLKGIQVDPSFGTPFLTATQVFDLRPTPRKWLSLERTDNAEKRFVAPGTILVTCSGTVGRATLARNCLDDVLISHDILRVQLNDDTYWGWLYAYLRAPIVIRLMQSAQYGHIIKHLEVAHLDKIPVIEVNRDTRADFTSKVTKILDYRNRAETLVAKAEAKLASAFELPVTVKSNGVYSSVRSSELSSGRRRLEGAFHTEAVGALLNNLRVNGVGMDTVKGVTTNVWWMTRFSRQFGNRGVRYRSADDLFSISQISDKRVYTAPIANHSDFFVKKGWILMACSGQVYGLNGAVTLATKHDEQYFFSHDLIRIAPRSKLIRPGYLYAYLGHPDIGSVLAKRAAYGSSVPHIDPGDAGEIPVARLTEASENEIADLAEQASQLNAEAAGIERQIGRSAEEIVELFVRS